MMKSHFMRVEKKYILTEDQSNQFRESIIENIGLDEYRQKDALIDIRNSYLESDTFCVYTLRKQKKRKRFKIRFREYGKDGEYDSSVWVELKEKRDSMGYKNRFVLEKEYIQDLLRGRDIYRKILVRNKEINSCYLKDVYTTVRDLIEKNELHPRILVQYRREAFQDGMAAKLRVTFDSALSIGVLSKGSELFTEQKDLHRFPRELRVMEIKALSKYPRWLREMLEKHQIRPETFSKFMFAIETLFKPELIEMEVCRVSDFKPIVVPESV